MHIPRIKKHKDKVYLKEASQQQGKATESSGESLKNPTEKAVIYE